jgi:5-formaminoimidazole-4-carboxamide-1-(beta)-D-ribofuranosyl 5'-monophosphate synthetase
MAHSRIVLYCSSSNEAVGKVINRGDIQGMVSDYKNATIGALGSHSALDISKGAKDEGFKSIVVCQKGREKTYDKYYKTDGGEGVVDETIVLDKFHEITKPEVLKQLNDKNTIFLPHRSFEVYVGHEAIENDFKVPIFGSRNLLRAEERDVPKNQYWLMDKAGIPYPKVFEKPKDIDRLALVKVSEAERSYERAFFLCSSPEEFEEKSKELIEGGRITQNALDVAVIEEFVMGAQVNFNYFYSPLKDKLELLGTDMRRQTNLDGILRLPAPQQEEVLKYVEAKSIEAGHVACTMKESLLEQVFELGEKFVDVSKKEYDPGIIGPFALQATFIPGPPKERAITFDISLRVQGSPGTKFTPYSGYLHREEMSVGRRIALEIKNGLREKRLEEIVT